jgi:hypothetical protein
MAQEFTIKSEVIESKINQLLPSQSGYGAGIDFSASTMVIPIIDLTETASGSGLREDLQTSLSLTSTTNTLIQAATNTVLVNTPGYFRIFGIAGNINTALQELNIFDSTTSRVLLNFNVTTIGAQYRIPFDFIVFLKAGDSLRGTSTAAAGSNFLSVTTRQIADVLGDLVNPL